MAACVPVAFAGAVSRRRVLVATMYGHARRHYSPEPDQSLLRWRSHAVVVAPDGSLEIYIQREALGKRRQTGCRRRKAVAVGAARLSPRRQLRPQLARAAAS